MHRIDDRGIFLAGTRSGRRDHSDTAHIDATAENLSVTQTIGSIRGPNIFVARLPSIAPGIQRSCHEMETLS